MRRGGAGDPNIGARETRADEDEEDVRRMRRKTRTRTMRMTSKEKKVENLRK